MERQTSGEPRRFSVSDEEVIADPGLWGKYLNERLDARKTGEPVWIIRNLNTEDPMTPNPQGPVYDFYESRLPRGYVEGSERDGYLVYGPLVELGGRLGLMNGEPLELLSEAKKLLAGYIEDVSRAQG